MRPLSTSLLPLVARDSPSLRERDTVGVGGWVMAGVRVSVKFTRA